MGEVRVVCANLIESEGKFLLVKETKEIAKDLYNLPAGKMERDEDLIAAAIREAKEETGLDVKPVKFIGIYQKPVGRQGNNVLMIVFKSEIMSGKLKTSKQHPDVRFMSYTEIKKLEREGKLRDKYILASIDDYRNKHYGDLSFVKIYRT